jgi:hypothetical protein
MLVDLLPFMLDVSVNVARLRRFCGSESAAVRVFVRLYSSPPGVLIVIAVVTGDCIPKRESGPCVVVVTVPSGAMTVLLPSVPIVAILWPLPAYVLTRRVAPMDKYSTV